MQCCKCDKNLTVVSCAECAKSIEEGKGASMCEECCTTFHDALGKFSAAHNVVALQPENKVKQEFEQHLHEYIELKDQQRGAQLKELDETMKQVEANCVNLQEQMAKNIELFKMFLDVKLSEFTDSVAVTRDYKLELLTQKKTLIKEEHFTPPSFEEELMETKLADLKQLLATLRQTPPSSSLPPLCGGTSCGFPPELVTLQRATVCMKIAHQADLLEGETVLATVIGTLTKEGTFWVRMLPDEYATQDIVLQNISNSLQVEFSVMSSVPKLSFLQPGDLCAARYSQDQRWYRARVINPKTTGKVTVFFLDYGNTEELPLASLAPLHDKYQVYPFQMVQCCFSTDNNLTYEREVRWKFTDLTHNRILSATILKCSHVNVHGMLHIVQLLDKTGSEPSDIGKTVLVLACKRAEKDGGSSIKCRDIRLKNQDLPANFEHIVSTATSTSAMVPDQQAQVSSKPLVNEEPIVVASSIEPSNEEIHTDVDGTAVRTQQDVEGTAVQTQQDVEGTAVQTQHDVEGTAVQTQHDVEGTAVQTQHDVEGTAAQTQHDVEGTAVQTQHDVEGTAVQTQHDVEGTAVQTQQDEGVVIETTEEEKTSTDQVKSCETEPKEVNKSKDTSEVTEMKDEEEHRPFQKSQARVKPLKIEKESSPPIPSQNGVVSLLDGITVVEKDEVNESNLYFVIEPGTVVDIYITTGLSPDGSFWAQPPTTPEYDAMMERLQDLEKDILTPIFFNAGDLCAAIYSEDDYWYRARVEDVAKGVFTVRYLDFGNSETRENQHLSPLPSQFGVVPFQALHCSIADEGFTSFSQISIDKFEQILSTEEPISATVVKMEDELVHVQLQLKIGDAKPVDVNWEVCSADVSKLESMSFTSRKTRDDEKLEPLLSLPELSETTNWADFMDDLASPRNDGFLTLSGVDSSSTTTSDHSKTPTPTPTPVHEPTVSKEPKKFERQSVSPPAQDDNTRPSTTRPAPRLDMGMARNRILSSLGPKRKDRSEGETARSRGDYSHRPESGETWDSSSTRHRDPLQMSSTVPRRRKLLEPDANQVKIYVRNMPLEKTIEEVRELFGQFGDIHGLQYHTEIKDRIFLIMGKSEGHRAIEKLDGHMFTRHGRPLVVQLGHNQRTNISAQRHMSGPGYSSSPPRQRSPISGSFENVSSGDRMKLFVKNVPPGKSLEDIRDIFSKYGKVFNVVQDPSRRHVVFLHTTIEAAKKAINNLHGRAISKSSRPLVVEETR